MKSGKSGNSKNARRDFLQTAGLVTAGSVLGAGCARENTYEENVNVNFNKTFRWKMFTTWPPNFPLLGEGCQMFANWVKEMSGGRMEIRVFGGGEIVPALETLEAVEEGVAEIGNAASYYWAGKMPASQLFAAVPFGLTAQQVNTWLIAGGGVELWEELYSDFNLVPVPAGNTGVQMGGWFNKKIESGDDLKGLKMRIPGLGGKAFSKAGGTSVLVSGGEIYTNLERGVIDGTEWIGPYHDYIMGFHQIADYYYYPGWHEPGTVFELFFNREKLFALPSDLRMILKTAGYRLNLWCYSQFQQRNAEYLGKIKKEKKVQILKFPNEVLEVLRSASEEVLSELEESDSYAGKVLDSIRSFQKTQSGWNELSDKAYFQLNQ